MSSIIITEFKKIIKEKTGQEFDDRRNEIKNWSDVLQHNFMGAKQFLEHNIVEVKFDRKLAPKPDEKHTRRMLCTRNFRFAKKFAEFFGNRVTPYQPKNKRPISWYTSRNIILVFDLLENNYRMIHLKKWKVLDFITIHANNVKIINDFSKKINPNRLKEPQKKAYYRK
jgi:hypothetical protein